MYYIRLLQLCATYFVLYSFLFFIFYFLRNVMRFSQLFEKSKFFTSKQRRYDKVLQVQILTLPLTFSVLA